MRLHEDKVQKFVELYGFDSIDRGRTFKMPCPICGRHDKFSMLKANGYSICYHGSCTYGKKPFWGWLALIANVTVVQAKEILAKDNTLIYDKGQPIKLVPWDESQDDEFDIVGYPPKDYYPVLPDLPNEGVDYLLRRQIPKDIIDQYAITYSPKQRRVCFPVFMDEACYGYQARAIDQVAAKDRMRNNINFRRESLIMFYDRIETGKHVILAEGPVDALKFHLCGGNVATMGKVVTDKQLELIIEKRPKRIYLALDEDADEESRLLAEKIYWAEIYKIELPPSTILRCQVLGKKADFGEATFNECKYMFDQAKPYDKTKKLPSILPW